MYEVSTKYVVLLLQYALVLLDGRPINYSWALQIFTYIIYETSTVCDCGYCSSPC